MLRNPGDNNIRNVRTREAHERGWAHWQSDRRAHDRAAGIWDGAGRTRSNENLDVRLLKCTRLEVRPLSRIITEESLSPMCHGVIAHGRRSFCTMPSRCRYPPKASEPNGPNGFALAALPAIGVRDKPPLGEVGNCLARSEEASESASSPQRTHKHLSKPRSVGVCLSLGTEPWKLRLARTATRWRISAKGCRRQVSQYLTGVTPSLPARVNSRSTSGVSSSLIGATRHA